MSFQQPGSLNPIRISDITLKVRPKSHKTLNLITLQTQTGSFSKGIPVTIPPGETHKEEFNPTIQLSEKDRLSILMEYRSLYSYLWRRTLTVTVEWNELNGQVVLDNYRRKTYSTSHRNVEIIIGVSDDSAPSQGNTAALAAETARSSHHIPLPTIDQNMGSSNNAPPPISNEIPTSTRDVLLPSATGQFPDVPATDQNIGSSDNVPSPAADKIPTSTGDVLLPSATGQISGVHDSGQLRSTTQAILEICPRFRLLVIGNTGVGKSTLIENVFKVKGVHVSENVRGQAEIDDEFVAEDNKLFVVHDSMGLEAGESKNLTKINDFIERRQKMKNLKDRIHAIWVCLPVPYAKGRVLETGMEEFLRNRVKTLDNTPIIVVLTKLDLLDNSLLLDLYSKGAVKSLEQAKAVLEPERRKFLDEYCGKPLQNVSAGNLPRVAVSTKAGSGLESTIPELVRETVSEIRRCMGVAPAKVAEWSASAQLYVAGMAQRGSIEEKVNHTIELGKQKYWMNLAKAMKFSNEEVKDRLRVLHNDIIEEWNFIDLDKALIWRDFQEDLSKISDYGVEDVVTVDEIRNSVANWIGNGVQDILGRYTSRGVIGAITLPMLLFRGFKSSKIIVKCIMAYIVNLVYVMKILFILAPLGTITSQDVKIAWEKYDGSLYKRHIQSEISNFDFDAGVAILTGGRDVVIDKIEELIKKFDITDKEMAELRKKFQVK